MRTSLAPGQLHFGGAPEADSCTSMTRKNIGIDLDKTLVRRLVYHREASSQVENKMLEQRCSCFGTTVFQSLAIPLESPTIVPSTLMPAPNTMAQPSRCLKPCCVSQKSYPTMKHSARENRSKASRFFCPLHCSIHINLVTALVSQGSSHHSFLKTCDKIKQGYLLKSRQHWHDSHQLKGTPRFH